MKISTPKRIRHSYTQSLVAPPATVFPLLCPVRETEWVQGWDPELVLTTSGAVEPDCVFLTLAPPRKAIWVVTRHAPETFELEMVKVTPEHTVGKLQIALSEDGTDGSLAEITNVYTSLGPDGDAFLRKFTAEWYHTYMARWEQALNHYLTTGKKLVV